MAGKKIAKPLDPADRGTYQVVGGIMYTFKLVSRSCPSWYIYIGAKMMAVYHSILNAVDYILARIS